MQRVVVYDTNILLSSVVFGGTPRLCLDLARQDIVRGVTCLEILDELVETLLRKFEFTQQEATDTVADLLTFLEMAPITNALQSELPDPDDNKILECAVAGGATHIVTGDRHLLTWSDYQGISIVRAADLLGILAAS